MLIFGKSNKYSEVVIVFMLKVSSFCEQLSSCFKVSFLQIYVLDTLVELGIFEFCDV